MFYSNKSPILPNANQALAGRSDTQPISEPHFVNQNPIIPPFPEDTQQVLFGMGCYWGAERLFWKQYGVYSTAVGFAGGITPNPKYKEVCTGLTGHSEVVLVVYNPKQISFEALLKLFWENHDPTQGMRQGNDIGTQYRSCIYTFDEQQLAQAQVSQQHYQQQLHTAGFSNITTEISLRPTFYYAEQDHQQYLAKHPDGYCGLRGTGIETTYPK